MHQGAVNHKSEYVQDRSNCEDFEEVRDEDCTTLHDRRKAVQLLDAN